MCQGFGIVPVALDLRRTAVGRAPEGGQKVVVFTSEEMAKHAQKNGDLGGHIPQTRVFSHMYTWIVGVSSSGDAFDNVRRLDLKLFLCDHSGGTPGTPEADTVL